jgi:UDP-3-O-[3-hydroxymyristoyl] glucosamine N-acyltransferase
MEHPGFFNRAAPLPLSQLAAETEASLEGGGDTLITDVRPLDLALAGHVSFFENQKYRDQLAATSATACYVHPKNASRVPPQTIALVATEPYRSFAKALWLFYPDARFPKAALNGGGNGVHPSAEIEEDVRIEPGAVIGPEARIGRGTIIAAGAVIGYRVHIGRDCYIGARAVVTHALIGNQVLIHAGVAIGQDGFGFAMGARGHFKVPQIGRVIIQDNVEIGANTTIDRGALRDTIVGEGTKIDNLVQIAHNVVIGRHCIIVAQSGISGSTVLEDFVVMGGQSGTVGHIRLGAGAQLAGNSGVAENIPAGERWGGTPAKPMGLWAREVALMKRLVAKRGIKAINPTGGAGD